MQQLAPCPSQRGFPSHGLVSLWQMFRIHLDHYVTLGRNMANLRQLLDGQSRGQVPAIERDGRILPINVASAVPAVLRQVSDACNTLDLNISHMTIEGALKGRVSSAEQIETLLDVVRNEMAQRLFLRVPTERAKYWESDALISDPVLAVFPVAASEIRASGTAYACGLWSASVFHSMRSAEACLVKIADDLGLDRNGTEQWRNIIDAIEKRLGQIQKMPKTSEPKRDDLQPISSIVVDLRLFKDAWRNQVSHSIVEYSDGRAHEIMHAVIRVLEASAAWNANPLSRLPNA